VVKTTRACRGTIQSTVIASQPPRSRLPARALTAYQMMRARQRRLEGWLERRVPALYDMRHAATGIGRALWPLLGPLLAALILLPLIALLAWLVALLGLEAPSIDLPSVDLPDIPLPDITAPAWLVVHPGNPCPYASRVLPVYVHLNGRAVWL